MNGPRETAITAWGGDAPDWVIRLADECAATSQNRVAKKINRSPAVVSNVLRNKYAGDMEAVEALVRGTFMDAITDCPELGMMPAQQCVEWRQKSKQFGNANMLRVRMYRACARCPKNQKGDTQ